MSTPVLGVVFIGFPLWFVIPRGSGGPGWLTAVWGLGRQDSGDIRKWASVAFVVLLVIHVWLRWDWIVGAAKRVLGGRTRRGWIRRERTEALPEGTGLDEPQ